MGKASKKKTMTDRSGTPPGWRDPPAWAPKLLAVAAVAGFVLAGISTWVHTQVTSSAGAYTSFCNLSATVNCDDVVTSRYGYLLGVPVSVWAIGFYAALLLLARQTMKPRSRARDRGRADALVLATAGLGFSVYMAAVSVFVLETVCLLCIGLYATGLVAFGAAVAVARPFSEATQRIGERWRTIRRRPILATSAALAVAMVVLLPGWLSSPIDMSREEIFEANPEFYDWYTNRPIVDVPTEGGHTRGPENAPVTLVEFSDLECPHCRQAHVTLKDLLPRYGDRIRFVFYHFPLSRECNSIVEGSVHRHACDAAAAAECAAQADRFEPYVNVLFANQDALQRSDLVRYAGRLGLDEETFRECLQSEKAAVRIEDDLRAAARAGVRSTPTFFVNGRKVEGNLSYQNWLLALAIELDGE